MARGMLPTVASSGGGLTKQVPISGVDAVLNVPAAADALLPRAHVAGGVADDPAPAAAVTVLVMLAFSLNFGSLAAPVSDQMVPWSCPGESRQRFPSPQRWRIAEAATLSHAGRR